MMRAVWALLLSGAVGSSPWAEGDACAQLQAAWAAHLPSPAWSLGVDCSAWQAEQRAALAREACAPAEPPAVWRAGRGLATFRCEGGRQRAMPVIVRLSSDAWVATQPILAQRALQPGDFERRPMAWREGETAPLEAASLTGLKARKALKVGQALMPADVGPDGVVAARSAVKVVLNQGSLRLEMPGQLVADAQVGGRARAQLQGRRELIDGQLMTATTLVVEER